MMGLLLLLLLRQLYARVRTTASPAKGVLLPVVAPKAVSAVGEAGPFMHWSTLALAEVFLSAYVACWAGTPLIWSSRLATGSAATLLGAACYRALLMARWHCRKLKTSDAPASGLKPKPQPTGSTPTKPPPTKGASRAPELPGPCARGCARMLELIKKLASGGSKGAAGKGAAGKGPGRRPPGCGSGPSNSKPKAKTPGKKSLL